jgi:PAS domain S-box-containing protein
MEWTVDPSKASPKLNVVLVEDDDDDAELILDVLATSGLLLNVTRATKAQEVRAALSDLHQVDAVLCDYFLGDYDALRTLELIRLAGTAVPLIVVSGGLSDEQAAACMREGATDYVLKDRLSRLPHALTQAIQHARAERAGRKVELSYRRLFENLPVAVFRATAAGQILTANPATVAMFGFADLESLRTTSLLDLHVEPKDRTALLERLHTEGHVLDFGCQMRRVDGSEFWLSRAVHAVREEDGRVVEMETIGSDTTQAREALRRLRESEAYLSTVIETAPDAVVRMDESGVITDWNTAAQDTFGWKRADAVGRRLSHTIVPLVFRERYEEGLRRVRREGSSELIGRRWDTFEGLRKNGEVFPIELAISPSIPHGDTKEFVGFARDISERKRAERELAQSEEVFRALFEQAAVGILLYDLSKDGVSGPVQWNARMREMLGVDANPDDLSWVAVLTGGRQREAEEKYTALLSGETTQLRERRMLTHPDGATVWADLSTVLVRDRDDQPLRFQTMALDITEQVEAEQRLSRRAAQQTMLVELSRAGLEGHETADFLATAVELVTRGTETQFGTILEMRQSEGSLVRVAAHGHADQIPSDPAPIDLSSLVLDALASEMPVVTFDYHAQPELQLSQWMIDDAVVASMAVGIRGPISPFGVLSVHSNVPRDFSANDLQFMQLASTIISVAVERKRAEKQRRLLLGRLVTAQEAERKTIAEDIHDDAVQVMTAANMRLELFRMALTDPVQVDAAEKLQDTVSLATGRLRNLLFQLSPPDLDRHGLASALRRHLEQFEADAGVRWELDSELDHEPPRQVRILLFRIFQEALVNVRKHAHASKVSLSLENVDGGVMMRLLDDGVGFHESAAEPLAGHLGLASMRERAEIAGGWWRLTSEPGRGTDVSTWVPAPRDEDSSDTGVAEVMAVA